MRIVNILLIADMVILLSGFILLFIRPFGVDMTWGIAFVAAGFILSAVLFLIKMKLYERKKN